MRVSRKPLIAAAVLTLLCAQAAPSVAASFLQYQALASDPPDESPPSTPRLREKGRKGIAVRFGIVNEFGVSVPGVFTIAVPGPPAQPVSLTIDMDAGTPPLICTATETPAPNQCGYVVSGAPGGSVDTVKVFFNGDLPAEKKVRVSVANVTASGMTQDPNPALLHFATGSTAPRLPVSTALVFDVSGSMSSPAVPGASTSRMVALQQAAGFVLDSLPGHVMLGDRLGVTYFNNQATEGTLAPAHVTANIDAVRNSIAGRTPTGSTSIGAGLKLANSAGFASDSNTRKFVLLFSDGDQNASPRVDQTPSTCSAGPSLKVGGAAYPAGISVCPITTGVLTACGFKLQQSIGIAACNGNYLHIPTGSETFAQTSANMFFAQTLNSALIGDKLEIVREILGTVDPASPPTENFRANAGDIAMTLLVAWPELPRTARGVGPAMRLHAPDGTEVDIAPYTRVRPGSQVTSLHFPLRQSNAFIDPAGEWRITFDPLPGSSEVRPRYQVIVVTDSPVLASEARAQANDPGTGEPIPLEVRLTDAGTPIPGATVVAHVVGPENGLGDSLARAETQRDLPSSGAGDAFGSPARAKLNELLQRPDFIAQLKEKDLNTVTLTADSAGVYRGGFEGAEKEGHYQFTFNSTGTSSVGDFERTQRQTLFVRPKPAADRTELKVASWNMQQDGSVMVRLSALAQDQFGARLGPDYGAAMAIRASTGTAAGSLVDRLDGSYDIDYRLPDDSVDPQISLVVMGDVVKDAPLSSLPGAAVNTTGLPSWVPPGIRAVLAGLPHWLLALLILLLVLVLYLIWRWRTSTP